MRCCCFCWKCGHRFLSDTTKGVVSRCPSCNSANIATLPVSFCGNSLVSSLEVFDNVG